MTTERVADQFHCPSAQVAVVVAATLGGEEGPYEVRAVGPVVHWKTYVVDMDDMKKRVKATSAVIKNRERVSA
jgi:hypothetical protein